MLEWGRKQLRSARDRGVSVAAAVAHAVGASSRGLALPDDFARWSAERKQAFFVRSAEEHPLVVPPSGPRSMSASVALEPLTAGDVDAMDDLWLPRPEDRATAMANTSEAPDRQPTGLLRGALGRMRVFVEGRTIAVVGLRAFADGCPNRDVRFVARLREATGREGLFGLRHSTDPTDAAHPIDALATHAADGTESARPWIPERLHLVPTALALRADGFFAVSPGDALYTVFASSVPGDLGIPILKVVLQGPWVSSLLDAKHLPFHRRSKPIPRTLAQRFSLGLLDAMTWMFTGAFAVNSLQVGGRGTHTYGVAGRGTFEVTHSPAFPAHPYFRPGRKFAVEVRHANVIAQDDAHKGFRGMAVRFFGEGHDGRLDLLMNTGALEVFWHTWNFRKVVWAGAVIPIVGTRGRRYVQTTTPPMWKHTQHGARRAPSSYSNLYFQARVAFDYFAYDRKPRLVHFRAVPWEPRLDTDGLPTGSDLLLSWERARLPTETRPADYLRSSFIRDLQAGRPRKYRLQLQLHETGPDEPNETFSVAREWEPASHPWIELGELTLTSPMSEEDAERFRAGLYNMPDSLGVPMAETITDYRSIGSMRVKVYPRVQALRIAMARVLGRPGPGDYPGSSEPHKRRGLLMLVVPISAARMADLDALLTQLGQSVDQNPGLPFAEMNDLHFARFVIMPAGPNQAPARLIYSANVDGRPETHLYHLIQRASLVREIFAHCEGLEGCASWSDKLLFDTLWSYQTEHRNLHEGHVGRSQGQIREEERLRRELSDFVDAKQWTDEWRGKSAREILEVVRTFVRDREGVLVQGPPPGMPLPARISFEVNRVLVPLATVGTLALPFAALAILLFPVVGAFAPIIAVGSAAAIGALGFGILRWYERRDPELPLDLGDDAERLVATEDYQVQNQLSMMVPIKPEFFRNPLLRLTLHVGDYLTRNVFVKGRLRGIPTIHFAHFFIDEPSRQMVFLSNYDGNWQQYLGDFLTTGNFVVVPIWTNLQGCPRTRFLFFTPPGFGEKFKPFIRHWQVRTQVWYSAYRDLSVENINQNTRMRELLWRATTETEARAFLALLGH